MAAVEQLVTDYLDLWAAAIKRKSTAGRGSSSKIELYGIKKLRELILGTALRGLIDRTSGSLPRTIDQEIRNARNSYYKQIGKKPKEYSFGPALLTEFDLPSGWAWKRIGDLCDLQTGATPSTQNPEYFGGDIRWLVSGDINQGIIEDCEGRITAEGLSSSNCKILPPKTVLIALNGQGKTRASVALLNVPAACNQSLVGMIPFDASILDSKFLLLSLRYRYYEIRDITGQNQRRGLNMGLVSELSIPLPPLAEQHRIAAKVDELMALCDQLEQQTDASLSAHQTLLATLLNALTSAADHAQFASAWQRIAEHFDTLFTTEESIDQLKQSILQLAVMGKLVPQDPSDEPASELLKKLAAEKAKLVKEGKIRNTKPLPPIAAEEKPFKLPSGWAFCRLQELVSILGDGLHGTPNYDDNGDYYFINGNNLNDGEILIKPDTKRVGLAEFEKYKKELTSRTVLISINGTIGNIAFFNDEKVILGKSACYFNLLSGIEKSFIKRFVESPLFFNYAASQATTNTISNLGLKAINAFPIPLPPTFEQQRIVAKVDELFALCDQLKFRLTDAQVTQLHLADTLAEKVLTNA